MTVDKKAHDLDGMTISCIQFLTTGILCSVIVPFTDEVITFEAVKAAAVPGLDIEDIAALDGFVEVEE